MAWGQGRMGMCCHVRWYVIISGAVGVAKRIGWGGSGRPAIEVNTKQLLMPLSLLALSLTAMLNHNPIHH